MMISGDDLILLYGVFVYILLTGIMLFWNKNDIINKVKTYIWAGKGAKLFKLYKKDNTEEEFVDCCKPGGVIKHEGDVYAILRGTVFHNRAKNCSAVTLVEGNLNSIDPFDEVDDRVDTKQLRALFFAEREKAKSDLNPDVKLLKILVIGALIACGIAVVIAYFNYDATQKLLATMQPVAQYMNATMAHGTVTL